MTEPWAEGRIHTTRSPHKLYLLIACVIGGTLGLVFPPSHGLSISDAFPGKTQLVWYAGLLIGGVLGLVGSYLRSITGILLEQAGMYLLAGLAISFAFAAFAHTGLPAIPGALILGGFGCANAVRAYHIHLDLRVLRRDLRALANRNREGSGG